nr:PREDICTED: uncharacterized protein LOC107397489 [Tribolium castaneum]|eukprot:XP_015833261.1 PREDICTED: uncharacterized protein LOC107397489 [Tribolium castaneum]
MSDKRKVLVAKRKNERNPKIFPEKIVQEDSHLKHGTKRTISVTPKKNIANERLKRLRTSLNEEVSKSAQSVPKFKDKNCVRKRPTDSVQHEVSTKLFIKESASSSGECSNSEPGTPFIFKEEFLTQTNVFTTESPNPFAVGFQQTAVVSEEDMEWCPTDIEESKSTSDNTLNSQITSSCQFYIVVDTNIFLSELNIIANIVTLAVKGPREPVIFIPWIVTEELDFIKGDSNKRSLRQKAQDAIKLIEKTMSSKHNRMKGQTLMEANEQESVGANQDNKIIACCMQVLEKYENMVLLTNDINLKNKAHFNKIPVRHGTFYAFFALVQANKS